MTLDLSSLFHATIGFESLGRAMEELNRSTQTSSYPPYNIIKLEENIYRISIAIAGFKIEDIDITLVDSILIIKSSGRKSENLDNYLYKGIAYRAFEKKFRLADNIKISGAMLSNGLLDIDLKKIKPLKSKPEKIFISEKKAN